MAGSTSRGNARLALFLLALFFAAGAAAIAGWIALGLWLLRHAPGLQGWTAAALCGLAALMLAGWMLPRRRRVKLPGLEVTPREQPALFEELRQVARAVGEPLPAQLHLTAEPNAFAVEIEDLFGFGGRRVMGLGMPLLRSLERGELRFVIAHELGHFHGGEQRTSPWLLQARIAMLRTMGELAALHARASLLKVPLALATLPFRLIAGAFLHVSLAVRRDHERRADQHAVRVAGARAAISGLEKAHTAEMTFKMYLEQEVEPLLTRGVVPPLGEGFSQFLRGNMAVQVGAKWLAFAIANDEGRETHPSLRERLAAAEASAREDAAPVSEEDRRPAIEMIVDPERYETEPIAAARGARRISWSEAAQAWLPEWREKLARIAAMGAPLEIHQAPSALAELRVLLRKSGDVSGREPTEDKVRTLALELLTSAMAVAAADAGYELESVPGGRLVARRAALSFLPIEEVGRYLDEHYTKEQWRLRCRGLGLLGATSPDASKNRPASTF